MNKLQMPDITSRRRRIQDLPDAEACVVAALDTAEEQRDTSKFDDVMDKLGRIE